MDKIKAKLRVTWVQELFYGPNDTKSGELVKMAAVYSDDKTSENHSFSQATPAADLGIYITNPAAFGTFKINEEVYLDFTPIKET